ncbi:MAG: hypothetical protein JWR56_1426 [Massilia sp.]|nr:hypothetical protein [Massilia sp.]
MKARMPDPRFRHLVFDIHGVLLGRSEPAGHLPPGAVLAGLRAAGYGIRFLTNGSSVSRQKMVALLEQAGIEADSSEVFTAATTVAHYLRHGDTPRRLFVIGSDELRDEITRTAGNAIRWVGPAEADVVVVSRAPALDKGTLGLLGSNGGIRLIATCRDSHFPNGNRIDIGPGPTVQLIENLLGQVAHVLGKPNPYVLTAVMGIAPGEMAATLVVGDSLDQDIALANNAGAGSVLMVASDARSAAPAPGAQAAFPHPDRMMLALDELLDFLQRAP